MIGGRRKRPFPPTYRQTFLPHSEIHSSSRTASDGHASSSPTESPTQTPREAPPPAPAPSPPPPPPPHEPATAAHPHPYANLTVEQILAQPGRENLPIIDPNRPPGTLWFATDCHLGRSVSETIKIFFPEAYPNWRSTSKNIRHTWYKCFAQKWHWNYNAHNEQVLAAFNEKVKLRLNSTVCDWKKDWMEFGDDARPCYMPEIEVWDDLVRWWKLPTSEARAAKCSAAKRTPGPNGLPPMPHTSGQTPFAGRRLQMAAGGELPPMTDLWAATHKKGGVFVTPLAEQIYNDATARIVERETQVSPDGTPIQLTTQEKDEIFIEVAPKKKGRVLGMGSIQETPIASTTFPRPTPYEDPILREELDEAKTVIATLKETQRAQTKELQAFNSLLDILAASNPTLAAALEAQRRQSTGTTTQSRVPLSTDSPLYQNFNLDEDEY